MAEVATPNVPTQLRRIPVSSIRENKTALRAVDRTDEDYLGLLASVKKDGVLQTITVRECVDETTKEKYYGLIDGLHRVTAAKDAGIKELDCKVVTSNDTDVLVKQMILNIHRVETKPVEYTKQLQRIMAANPTMTLTELGNMIGKSSAYVSERMGLLKLSEKVAALVDGGKINISNAFGLAKLPVEEQPNFVDRAMTMPPGEFAPTISARAKEIREAKRQGKDPNASNVFTPVGHYRRLAELKVEEQKASAGPALVKMTGIKTAEEGFALGVKWALHLDPVSVKEAQAKHESREKEKADAEARRKAERDAKKQKEAAEAAVSTKNEGKPDASVKAAATGTPTGTKK